MAKRSEIPIAQLVIQPFHHWSTRWFLLAAGEFPVEAAPPAPPASAGDAAGPANSGFNFMTVSWGGLGYLWEKPFALVMVRPGRYTRGFMDRASTFTLSMLPESDRRILNYAGSHSGREGDKAKAAGLTPERSRLVAAPSFAEAELVLECRKCYFADFDPSRFLDQSIHTHYPEKDYHRFYIGEVLAASGTEAWAAAGGVK